MYVRYSTEHKVLRIPFMYVQYSTEHKVLRIPFMYVRYSTEHKVLRIFPLCMYNILQNTKC